VDDEGKNPEPTVRKSRGTPRLKYTTRSGAESRTKWNQSKPSIKSAAREAATGTLFNDIQLTPTLHESVRSPDNWEARVRSPEFITQSRETQELGAWPSNPVDTSTSQKEAREDMKEKAKSRVCYSKSRRGD
jgi:hypothetical protein